MDEAAVAAANAGVCGNGARAKEDKVSRPFGGLPKRSDGVSPQLHFPHGARRSDVRRDTVDVANEAAAVKAIIRGFPSKLVFGADQPVGV